MSRWKPFATKRAREAVSKPSETPKHSLKLVPFAREVVEGVCGGPDQLKRSMAGSVAALEGCCEKSQRPIRYEGHQSRLSRVVPARQRCADGPKLTRVS